MNSFSHLILRTFGNAVGSFGGAETLVLPLSPLRRGILMLRALVSISTAAVLHLLRIK